ncbi:MAG: BamA/TamA family outer membrane protein [Pseudomonadota bacterium]
MPTVAAFIVLACGPAVAKNVSVRFEGAPGDLAQTFRKVVRLEDAELNFPTRASIRRTAERDATALENALQSAGYYAGDVQYRLNDADNDAAPTVIFEIAPGPKFEITNYEIIYLGEAADQPKTLAAANLKPNRSSSGADLQALQKKFLAFLQDNGFPTARIVSRRVTADFESGEATAIFVFESGPRAFFGEAAFNGLQRVNPRFLTKLATWSRDEPYDQSRLSLFRDRLAATQLFSTIDVNVRDVAENGEADIVADLVERKHRTIGAGLSYSTAEGPGARLYFENRNIFGQGENFRVEIEGSQITQSIDFDISKPMPLFPGALFANFQFSNETTDAFDARTLTLAGGANKRWFGDRLTTQAALALETSKIEDDDGEERTYFASLPLSAIWDSENDLLNPTSGVRAGVSVTPFTGSATFTQAEAFARSRVEVGETFLVAARAGVGATLGGAFNDVPINKRFFAGGGGSVRGFGFQLAGPLDGDGDPIGGRSLIEAAVEIRAKVSQNIQLAAFIDTGSVSTDATPDFGGQFFTGVGGGVRYVTPIGPVRIDIAFPLDKRESDRSIQFYIAIGQPF